MTSDAYLRYPHISRGSIVFVAENDIWLVPRDGGRAYRVSADHVPARSPRLSPDGTMVAWSADRDGAYEVYVAPADGGDTRRLTFWGQAKTLVRGWLSDQEILVVTTAGQAERQRAFAHAVPIDGSPSRRLPYGWVDDLALSGDGGALLSTSTTVEPAWWKRYRGGTAARLWIDVKGSGEFTQVFEDLQSSLVSPLWVRSGRHSRIGFVSDHAGRGAVYSAGLGRKLPRSSDLERHTDGEFYARHAASDGRSVVYVAGGSLYLLDSLAAGEKAREVEVRLGGARTSRQPKRVRATGHIATIAPDRTGRSSVIETRGGIHLVTHREGPVRALATGSDVRRRLPVLIGDTKRVAWVSDASGDDAIEVKSLEDIDAAPSVLVPAGRVGRVLEMTASPDGKTLAVASHDGVLRVVPIPDGAVKRAPRLREIDQTEHGDMQGLAFSPDSRWLVWSHPGREPLRHLKMVEIDGGKPFEVTPLRFTDTEPVFTSDGKHLAFLSVRSLDPVYDSLVFDLSFPNGWRPHLLPLAADIPSPFDPRLGGRPFGDDAENDKEDDTKAAASRRGKGDTAPQPETTRVDLEGLDQRIVPIPVPGGHYEQLRAVKGGLAWLKKPLQGVLGDDRARLEDEPPRATVEHIDLATAKVQELASSADLIAASGDGTRLVVLDKDDLRIVPAQRKVEKDDPENVRIDLGRVRIEVRPVDEWRQMYNEAWRLMRDHYWRADMRGVDWVAAGDRYRPLLDRLGSHDDLVDLIWEMHAELGTSHAYVAAPPSGADDARKQGLLGADIAYVDGDWRIVRIVPGESSEPRARSPLTAPGVAARVGDVIANVDGHPTDRQTSPASLLVGTAGKPVELTLQRRGTGPRRVVVVPLADEMPLRYQDWVNGRRAHVHGATQGKVGYVHVPDMVSGGWAQLHRDLRTEVSRDALIVDVRGNRGGHTSQLVLEKLVRKIIGWDLARGYAPESYPADARRGPMVTVTDCYAGSDGDIITAAIRSMELGPVIGTRTWGGVVGIDGRYSLVDGTSVTQPRFSFWFEKFGWGVENYGVDPDIEVVAAPHDRTADRDVQLDYALNLVQDLLEKSPAKQAPSLPPL